MNAEISLSFMISFISFTVSDIPDTRDFRFYSFDRISIMSLICLAYLNASITVSNDPFIMSLNENSLTNFFKIVETTVVI